VSIKYLFLSVIIAPIFIGQCFAQFGERQIEGTVYDSETGIPISYVALITSTSGAITNVNGYFALEINMNDTIYVNHINYRRTQIVASSIQDDHIQIFLVPKIFLLEELIFNEIPTEEEFKLKIIESKIAPTTLELNSELNFQNAHLIYLSGYTPPMDSWDNYKNYSKGIQGVTILSSDKSKGLLSILKSSKRANPKIQMNNYGFSIPLAEQDTTGTLLLYK